LNMKGSILLFEPLSQAVPPIDTLLYFICKSLSSRLNEVLSVESSWKPFN